MRVAAVQMPHVSADVVRPWAVACALSVVYVGAEQATEPVVLERGYAALEESRSHEQKEVRHADEENGERLQ